MDISIEDYENGSANQSMQFIFGASLGSFFSCKIEELDVAYATQRTQTV